MVVLAVMRFICAFQKTQKTVRAKKAQTWYDKDIQVAVSDVSIMRDESDEQEGGT